MKIVLQPAVRVAVIGYPFGQAVAEHYPVWVTGSLASEPEFDADGKPAMFVDCRTNRGSSGSPVFAYVVNSPVETEGHTTNPQPFMEQSYPDGRATGLFDRPVHRFIGIYSGRINDTADIGLVWRDEVIAATCGNGQKPA